MIHSVHLLPVPTIARIPMHTSGVSVINSRNCNLEIPADGAQSKPSQWVCEVKIWFIGQDSKGSGRL